MTSFTLVTVVLAALSDSKSFPPIFKVRWYLLRLNMLSLRKSNQNKRNLCSSNLLHQNRSLPPQLVLFSPLRKIQHIFSCSFKENLQAKDSKGYNW